MKYRLIGDNCITTPIETVLKNRNIDKDLFNLSDEVIENVYYYDHIKDGITMLINHINNNSKIILVADSDVDGATSFAIFYRYVKKVFNFSNIDFLIHTGKQHGLSKDIIIPKDANLVVLPDSSSNDFKQHKELCDKGVEILILDHHECDKGYSKNAVVINNQLSKKINNKQLSGAGVVYKFVKALDEYLFEDEADNYLDLVALGNIADMMDLHSKETRHFVYKGIKNINNIFLKALIKNNEFELDDKYNITKIGWVIAPKLNGMIRSGAQEEKYDMYKAFVSDDEEFCDFVAKKCRNAKQRQDGSVKRNMAKIQKFITLKEHERCLFLDVNKDINSNHIGLIAQKVAEYFGVPVLLCKEEGEYFQGSGRGNINITKTLRSDLLKTKMIEVGVEGDVETEEILEFAQGHENAFGFKVKKDKREEIKAILNKKYNRKEVISGKSYSVDFILNKEDINQDFVDELAEYEDEFGNGIDVPLLVVENLELNLTNDNLKGKLNIVFEINGVKIIKKFTTKILKEKLINEEVICTLIGKCTINTYNNKGQIEIVDLEIIN